MKKWLTGLWLMLALPLIISWSANPRKFEFTGGANEALLVFEIDDISWSTFLVDLSSGLPNKAKVHTIPTMVRALFDTTVLGDNIGVIRIPAGDYVIYSAYRVANNVPGFYTTFESGCFDDYAAVFSVAPGSINVIETFNDFQTRVHSGTSTSLIVDKAKTQLERFPLVRGTPSLVESAGFVKFSPQVARGWAREACASGRQIIAVPMKNKAQ